MSIIGGPMPEEDTSVDSLLVLLSELRRQNRQLREDLDYYRGQAYRYRKTEKGLVSCYLK